MSALLKGCPFCGNEAEIERYGDRSRSTIYACTFCGCRLETGEEWGHGTDWNHRAEGHTEGREKGFREGIEAAAKGAGDWLMTNTGLPVEKVVDLEEAVRALSPAPQSRGDDDYRADVLTINDLSDIIQLHLQLRDFGRIEDGNFVTSTAQMNDFIEQCDKAAEAIIEHIKDAPAPTKDSAGDGGEG